MKTEAGSMLKNLSEENKLLYKKLLCYANFIDNIIDLIFEDKKIISEKISREIKNLITKLKSLEY